MTTPSGERGSDGIDDPDISRGIDDPELTPDEGSGIEDPEIRPGEGSEVDDPNIRPGGSEVDDPDIRPPDQAIDDPEIRTGVDDPDLRTGVDNPDIRAGVDNPEIRQGVGNPDIRTGVDNPDLQPPSAGGLSLSLPKLIGLGVGAAVIIASAIVILNPGGAGGAPGATSSTTNAPGATGPAAATAGPGATAQAGATSAPGGSGAAPADASATLVITGGGIDGSWTLDGISGDVSPTDTLIAAVWTETIDNVAAGYGDLVTVSIGGPVISGSAQTSAAGVTFGFSLSRYDAAGTDVFSHQFSSRAGECTITMSRSGGDVSGTFSCPSITSTQGATVNATGTFKT